MSIFDEYTLSFEFKCIYFLRCVDRIPSFEMHYAAICALTCDYRILSLI